MPKAVNFSESYIINLMKDWKYTVEDHKDGMCYGITCRFMESVLSGAGGVTAYKDRLFKIQRLDLVRQLEPLDTLAEINEFIKSNHSALLKVFEKGRIDSSKLSNIIIADSDKGKKDQKKINLKSDANNMNEIKSELQSLLLELKGSGLDKDQLNKYKLKSYAEEKKNNNDIYAFFDSVLLYHVGSVSGFKNENGQVDQSIRDNFSNAYNNRQSVSAARSLIGNDNDDLFALKKSTYIFSDRSKLESYFKDISNKHKNSNFVISMDISGHRVGVGVSEGNWHYIDHDHVQSASISVKTTEQLAKKVFGRLSSEGNKGCVVACITEYQKGKPKEVLIEQPQEITIEDLKLKGMNGSSLLYMAMMNNDHLMVNKIFDILKQNLSSLSYQEKESIVLGKCNFSSALAMAMSNGSSKSIESYFNGLRSLDLDDQLIKDILLTGVTSRNENNNEYAYFFDLTRGFYFNRLESIATYLNELMKFNLSKDQLNGLNEIYNEEFKELDKSQRSSLVKLLKSDINNIFNIMIVVSKTTFTDIIRNSPEIVDYLAASKSLDASKAITFLRNIVDENDFNSYLIKLKPSFIKVPIADLISIAQGLDSLQKGIFQRSMFSQLVSGVSEIKEIQAFNNCLNDLNLVITEYAMNKEFDQLIIPAIALNNDQFIKYINEFKSHIGENDFTEILKILNGDKDKTNICCQIFKEHYDAKINIIKNMLYNNEDNSIFGKKTDAKNHMREEIAKELFFKHINDNEGISSNNTKLLNDIKEQAKHIKTFKVVKNSLPFLNSHFSENNEKVKFNAVNK
ncbi:hypothetical protein L3V83_06660 [Thiotrichales bacterium 19X7-9]|nr:hypothetical protein [Thiotrichales bacterium 19X7-9]